MTEKMAETNARVSTRFFDKSLELVSEFEAAGDTEALDALPTVMLTTGIMALCRLYPTDTVAEILEVMREKVLRGEFTSARGLDE
jgi:hypothetical protein